MVVVAGAAGGAAAVVVKVVDAVLGAAAVGESIVEAARVDGELARGQIPGRGLRVVMVVVVVIGATRA